MTFPDSLPSAINGIGLAFVGMAIMLLRLSKWFGFENQTVLWIFVAIFSSFSILIFLIYFIRVTMSPITWLLTDMSVPPKIATIGALGMQLTLLAVVANECQFSIYLVIIVSLFGTVIQSIAMTRFLYQCSVKKIFPEPYWNAAVYSCFFPVISIPSTTFGLIIIRSIFQYFGLITIFPCTMIQIIRMFWLPIKTSKNPDVIANNPSVCILQSPFCAALTAWIVFPLTFDDSHNGTGAIITHIIFAFATLFIAFTWILMFLRYEMFTNLGRKDPSWSAATFPFVNSAISTTVYSVTMESYFSDIGKIILSIWICILATVASAFVIWVTYVYFSNFLFISCVPKSPDTDTGTVTQTAANQIPIPTSDPSEVISPETKSVEASYFSEFIEINVIDRLE